MNLFTVECLDCGHMWYDAGNGNCPKCQSPNVEMLHQAGQSLVGMIIAMGVVSFLMMALSNVITYAVKSNATVSANSEITSYIEQLRSNLRDPAMATSALLNANIKSQIAILDPLNASVTLAKAGYKQQPNNAWSVSSVLVDSIVAVPSQTGVYRLTIGMVFAKDGKRVIGPQSSHKVVTDVYCTLTGNLVTKCSGIADISTLSQQFCLNFAGTWNVTTGKCTLPSASTSSGSNSDSNDCSGDDNGKHKGDDK